MTSNTTSPESLSNAVASQEQQQQQPQQPKMREMMILPKGFEPTDQDVVIGRGKKARTHEGNNRLRGLIEFMIPEYSAAGSNKDEKSYIIKEIVTQIRKSSPDGGFVKFDKSQNRWFEVGDFLAREKISQTFRDAMGDSYSSSNPYKRKRRSFEKKHNAIMDIIKRRRRGSSPTSVVQGATASPPESPEPTPAVVDVSGAATRLPHPPSASVTPSPPLSPPRENPALLEMFKRPGQIGFARRSMLHFGMPPSTATASVLGGATTPSMHPLGHMPPMRSMRAPVLPGTALPPLRRSIPPHSGLVAAAAAAAAAGLPPTPTAAAAAALHGLPPTAAAAGMPTPPSSRRSSLPSYNPALMADMMMNRQHMVARNLHHAALVRRTSAPHGY